MIGAGRKSVARRRAACPFSLRSAGLLISAEMQSAMSLLEEAFRQGTRNPVLQSQPFVASPSSAMTSRGPYGQSRETMGRPHIIASAITMEKPSVFDVTISMELFKYSSTMFSANPLSSTELPRCSSWMRRSRIGRSSPSPKMSRCQSGCCFMTNAQMSRRRMKSFSCTAVPRLCTASPSVGQGGAE